MAEKLLHEITEDLLSDKNLLEQFQSYLDKDLYALTNGIGIYIWQKYFFEQSENIKMFSNYFNVLGQENILSCIIKHIYEQSKNI